MKRANYHILIILFITSNLFVSAISYSQWTVCGNLAGISGRPTVAVVDENTAYVTYNGLKWKDPQPHVFRTTNKGVNWTDISGNLPDAPVNAPR